MANVIEVVVRARDEASAQLKDILKEVGPLGAGLAAITAVAGGTAAALASFALQGGQRAEDLRKLALQTGLTTSAISEMELAARLSETTLEGLAVGIKFLQKNFSAAQHDGGELAGTFKQIGIGADEIKHGLGSADQLFERVATGISKIQDPGERTAVTLKLLGRAGVQLLPLLLEGGEGIRAMRERAEELGITVSVAAGIISDEFGDALETSQLQVDGLKAKLAQDLLPTIQEVTREFSALLTQLNKYVGNNPEVVRATFNTAVQVFALAASMAAVVVAAPIAGAALTKLGVDVGAMAAAGGPIALAIAAIALLIFHVNMLAEKASKPLRLDFKVATNLEGARSELNRLALEKDKLQRDLDNLESVQAARHAKQGGLTPTGIAIVGGIAAAGAASGVPGVASLFSYANATKVAKLKSAMATVNDSIELTRKLVKELGGDLSASTETGVAGIDKAALALAAFLAMLEDVKSGIGKLSQADIEKALAPPTIVKKDLGEVPPKIFDTENMDEGVKQLGEARKAARDLFDVVEQAGGSVERLIDAFVRVGTDGSSVFDGVTAGVEIFKAGLDPVAQEAMDVAQALGEFASDVVNNIVGVFQTLQTKSTSVFGFIGSMILALIKAVLKLIAELAIAIAKAIVLKAVKAFFGLSSGGTVDTVGQAARGGTVAGFAHGGSLGRLGAGLALATRASGGVPGFASGGAILQAAAGIYRVPGAPQRRDNVLIAAAGGEAILPTVGGREPGNLLAGLDRLGVMLERALTGGAFGESGPVIGELHVHAFDSDSVRNSVRPQGEVGRQMARASDLSRARGGR